MRAYTTRSGRCWRQEHGGNAKTDAISLASSAIGCAGRVEVNLAIRPRYSTTSFGCPQRLRAPSRALEPHLELKVCRHGLGKLGITFPTCWTSRAGQKPQSIVCAVRSEPPRIMSTRCSILRCCYSEATSTQRRRSTGGAISPRTANLNGQHGRVGP